MCSPTLPFTKLLIESAYRLKSMRNNMRRQNNQFLAIWSEWNLHGFLDAAASDQIFARLQSIRRADRDGDREALLYYLRRPENSEADVVQVVAAQAYTLRQDQDKNTVILLGQLVINEKNSDYLRMAVAQTLSVINHPDTILYLTQALIRAKNPQLRQYFAYALDQSIVATWQEKTTRLLREFDKKELYREHIDADTIIHALRPSDSELGQNRFVLSDYLIGEAINFDERMIGIVATLLVASAGHNISRAKQRIHHYEQLHDELPMRLNKLKEELNSLLAPTELQASLYESFQAPLEEVDKQVRQIWIKSIQNAQKRNEMHQFISLVLFVLSGVFIVTTITTFIWYDVGFAALNFFMALGLLGIAAVHSSSIKGTKQNLTDIGVANTVYMAYTQRSLQISHTYARLYLKSDFGYDDMQKTNNLLNKAMSETVKALRTDKPFTLDDFLAGGA